MLFCLQHYYNYKYLQAPTKWRNFASCKETQLLPRAIHGLTDPHSLRLSAHHIPAQQPVLLSHIQRQQRPTAGRTGAQPSISCPVRHQLGPTDPGLILCPGAPAQNPPAWVTELTPLWFPQLLLLLHACKILTILFPGRNPKTSSPVSLSKPLKRIYHTTQEFLSEGSSSHKAVPTVTRYRDPGSGSSTAINCLLTHWTKLYFKKMCSAGQSRKPQVRMHFIPQRCIIKEGLQICVGTALTPY